MESAAMDFSVPDELQSPRERVERFTGGSAVPDGRNAARRA
jgi:hypothetical protein